MHRSGARNFQSFIDSPKQRLIQNAPDALVMVVSDLDRFHSNVLVKGFHLIANMTMLGVLLSVDGDLILTSKSVILHVIISARALVTQPKI